MAARRPVRMPRPAVRAARPPRVPSQLHRNRRGPTPPDAVINALQSAHEADPDSRTGVWIAALLLAAHALNVKARREVSRAGVDVPVGTQDDPDSVLWVQQLHTGLLVRKAAGATLVVLLAWIASMTLAGFSRRVQHYSRAGGSPGYLRSTLLDARVRERHQELEGTYHLWSAPPVSGTQGFRGHPGEPGGCRCFCFPIPGPRK